MVLSPGHQHKASVSPVQRSWAQKSWPSEAGPNSSSSQLQARTLSHPRLHLDHSSQILYIIFENTELASIYSTCRLPRREAMPILQNGARVTFKGPDLLGDKHNWHILALMRAAFSAPPHSLHFRVFVIYDTEHHEALSLHKMHALCRAF